MFLVSAVDQILDSSAVAVILFRGNLHWLSREIRSLGLFLPLLFQRGAKMEICM